MKGFEENNCRKCKKVFCCKSCREKHETKQHDIFPGCDICISGKILISTTDDSVISHIKQCHWPLHCVICKRLFGSVDEILQHIKCPLINKQIQQKSPYTPQQSNENIIYASPYFFEKNYKEKLKLISNVATSTPMQTENKPLLENIQEVITPVYSENKEINNTDASSHTNLKRRVTFWDTPSTESFSKKSKNMTSSTNQGTYHTANDLEIETPEKSPPKDLPLVLCTKTADTPSVFQKENGEIQRIEKSVNIICQEENTLWISAINISATEFCTNFPYPKVFVPENNFLTPMVPKEKKINPVAPIVLKKGFTNLKLGGPLPISSTPNSSIVPGKSVPNIRDIFPNINQQASTSKSNDENFCCASNDGCELCDNSKENISSINASMPNKLWNSVSNMVKNVLQSFTGTLDVANNTTRPLKRHYSDTDDIPDSPLAKRYKIIDIQCRRTIREMTPRRKYMEAWRKSKSQKLQINIVNNLTKSTTKTFADKATQTDDDLITQ